MSAILLVPIAAGWGWRLWKDHSLSRTWLRIGLLPLGVLTTAIALSGIQAPEAWPLTAGLGGYAGTWLTGQIVMLSYDLSLPLDIRILVVSAAVLAPPILFIVIGFSGAEWRSGAQRTAGIVGGMRQAVQRTDSLRESLRGLLNRFQRPVLRRTTSAGERREPMLLDSQDGERSSLTSSSRSQAGRHLESAPTPSGSAALTLPARMARCSCRR